MSERPFPPSELRKTNPREFNRLYMRAYTDRNYDKVTRQRRMFARWNHHLLRFKLLLEFGPCQRCGYEDPRALQFDHVNGGGRQDKIDGRYVLSGPSYEKLRKRFLAREMQVLCSNCNWIKRSESKEIAQRKD